MPRDGLFGSGLRRKFMPGGNDPKSGFNCIIWALKICNTPESCVWVTFVCTLALMGPMCVVAGISKSKRNCKVKSSVVVPPRIGGTTTEDFTSQFRFDLD